MVNPDEVDANFMVTITDCSGKIELSFHMRCNDRILLTGSEGVILYKKLLDGERYISMETLTELILDMNTAD